MFISLFVASVSLANADSYVIKLDQFTLAKSNSGLNDTIDVTTDAWNNADSVHLFLYRCGGNFDGVSCRLFARDYDNKLFEMHFDNKGIAMQFSFSTKRIDPDTVKFVALTLGQAPTDNQPGLNYRMGFLRFI